MFSGSEKTHMIVIFADIISFITGTCIGWSSPVLASLKQDDISRIPLGRQITSKEESWIGSLSTFGGVFGSLIFGYLVEIIGRKNTVLVLALPFLAAYAIAAFAKIVPLFYVSRILMGLGLGGTFCILPIYIVEVVEYVNRGLLLASLKSFITAGGLFAYAVGPYVSLMTFNLILVAICVLFVPLFWYLAPETPYYLVSTDRKEDAFKSLQYLRRKSKNTIQLELEEIVSHSKQLQQGSFLDIFKSKAATKAFFFCVALTSFQHLSGITVITYYSQEIFDDTQSNIPPAICSIIVAAVQVIAASLSPPFVDKVGRKSLLLITIIGATVADILLGLYFFLQNNGNDVSSINWLPVFSLVMFIMCYNSGMASVPWTTLGEILPLNIISKGAMMVTSFYWFIGFLVTKYFGSISAEIGMAGSFWLFAGFCVLFELFVHIFMFETKGKSLKEIQVILNNQ